MSSGETVRSSGADSAFRDAGTINMSLQPERFSGEVAAVFLAKGEGETQVVAQDSKLSDAKAAARMKKSWGEALDRLKELIE